MEVTRFGHYELLELLGRGGMGQVFRAHDTVTDRVVALKVLPAHVVGDPVFQERFRREAHAAAGLSDPHVVPIHGYGEIDGQLYLDMRLIDGEDLGSALAAAGGPFPPERAVKIVEQVASALESAHSVGLVHRDVKPSNIFLAARDFVYLIDFGIARTTSQTGLTSAGSTLGTMAYMAPERFKTGRSDPRSDIYALTCVLHECLTGRRPYTGESLEQQLAGHLMTPPPLPSAVNPALPTGFDAVIAKGMAKKPDDRYQSALELADAARAVLGGPSSLGKRRPRHARPPRRFRNLAVACAGLALVLVAGFVVVQVRDTGGDTPASGSTKPSGSPTTTTAPPPFLSDPSAIAATVPAAIRSAGKLVVGVNEPYAPAEFMDSDGAMVGFDIDLMDAIARVLNLPVEYRETAFESILPSVQAGAYDVGLSSFTDTKEREQTVDFVTYFQAGTLWAQRPGTPVNPNNACGRKVGVKSRTIQDTEELPTKNKACLAVGAAPIDTVEFFSQDEAVDALVSGKVDAISSDSPVTGYAISQSKGALEAAGEIFDAAPYGLPVAKGSPLAESLRQAVMLVIKSGEYRTIMEKWGVEAGMITAPVINGAYN
ncbi:bifunctional serine/threonine-protein kinase/transporter substrate-binding domain-containing protein [Mycolicibacterium komossense]|uniref:non-specific serine/threonine protein kinase n=1 Tax=Mycolicibacterium komossense TaxID=1779 RepID=A0ABT3CB50_9MYCO|nr:bifunctional serine/threonine-protein kinase/transporter substrate-binding domain-containing protein [Mycolicibacterium komossense]MCV7226703.1 transporter substrate-binding domain-containing protein [Mycolicibacterium komossense]